MESFRKHGLVAPKANTLRLTIVFSAMLVGLMKALVGLGIVLILSGVMLVLLNGTSPHLQQVHDYVQVPYQATEGRQEVIGTVQDEELEGGHFECWNRTIQSGKTGEITWNGTGLLYVYVLTESQFHTLKIMGTAPSHLASDYASSGTITYNIQDNGTYYFAVSNPWIFTTLDLYSARARVLWSETVTKYRTESVNRNVADNLYLYAGLSCIIAGIIPFGITYLKKTRMGRDKTLRVIS
jgi:hypothetical protein